MDTKNSMEGGCLCGAIRYRISGSPISAEYCHCRMCQKVAGAAFANWVDLRVEQLQWTGEKPVEYPSSEFIRRGFCGTCGSTISFRNTEHPSRIGTTIASLDDPNLVQPSIHIYVESQVEWLRLNDDCERFTRERTSASNFIKLLIYLDFLLEIYFYMLIYIQINFRYLRNLFNPILKSNSNSSKV